MIFFNGELLELREGYAGYNYGLITLINITAYAFSPMAKIIYKIYKISAAFAARRIRT